MQFGLAVGLNLVPGGQLLEVLSNPLLNQPILPVNIANKITRTSRAIIATIITFTDRSAPFLFIIILSPFVLLIIENNL